jgi:hypothetical protein
MNFVYKFLSKPLNVGASYFMLLTLFSAVYWVLPQGSFNNTEPEFLDCFYFSTVTITTLGYGDVLPVTDLARVLVISEVVLGVILAGSFLNACSISLSQKISESERLANRAAESVARFNSRKQKLLDHDSILSYDMEAYLYRMWALFVPHEQRREHSSCDVIDENGNMLLHLEFKNMHHLYKSSILSVDGFLQSDLKIFLKYHDRLLARVEHVLNFAPLSDRKQLRIACLDFVTVARDRDSRQALYDAAEIESIHGGSVADHAVRLIQQFESEPTISQDPNILDPYISLYLMARAGQEFCSVYTKLMSEIKSSSYKACDTTMSTL